MKHLRPILISAAAALLLAWSPPLSAGAVEADGDGSTELDACRFLTEEEAAEILGGPVDKVESHPENRQCIYVGIYDPDSGLDIMKGLPQIALTVNTDSTIAAAYKKVYQLEGAPVPDAGMLFNNWITTYRDSLYRRESDRRYWTRITSSFSRMEGRVTEIPGLGDGAILVETDGARPVLTFLDGDAMFSITINVPKLDAEAHVAKAEEAAGLIMEKRR